MKVIRVLVVFCLCFCVHAVYSVDFFEEGTRAFQSNKPAEAAPLLAKAIAVPGVDSRAWIYLGTAYQQLGRFDDAAGIFRRGLSVPETDKKVLYTLLGNTYFLQNKLTFAEEMYTKATDVDPYYAPPVLNRANTRIKLNKLSDASDDYTAYLTLDPDTPQRPSIERIQALIAEQFMLERTQAEQAAAEKKAEEERLALLRKEEEERRQRILQEVESSLKMSAEDTTAVSADAEGIVSYDEESELE